MVYSVQYKSSPVAAVQFLIQNSEQTIEGTQKSFAQKLVSGCHFRLDLNALLALISFKRNFVILKG